MSEAKQIGIQYFWGYADDLSTKLIPVVVADIYTLFRLQLDIVITWLATCRHSLRYRSSIMAVMRKAAVSSQSIGGLAVNILDLAGCYLIVWY